jgi:hypothetical protein
MDTNDFNDLFNSALSGSHSEYNPNVFSCNPLPEVWVNEALNWVVFKIGALTESDWRDDIIIHEYQFLCTHSFMVEGTISTGDKEAEQKHAQFSMLRKLLYALIAAESRKCPPPEPEDFYYEENNQDIQNDDIPF